MKKTYKIEVDCANCADKMECAAGKVAGVESVTVNFMAQKMILEAEDDKFAEVLELAKKAVAKIEPDCTILLK